MLIFYLRKLTSVERSVKADIHLGLSLAFIAGAMNAGGFLAVQQYTSHMTGIISSMADGLIIGNINLALASVGALICFIAGAALNMRYRSLWKPVFSSVSAYWEPNFIVIWGFSYP